MTDHLGELLAACNEPPSVDQVELSPFLQQRELRTLCDTNGIAVEAYSPLTKGARLAHPVVVRVAGEVGATPAQVLLRWGVQQGLVVLPKSTHAARLAENLAALALTLPDDAMAALGALETGLVTGWDPRNVP